MDKPPTRSARRIPSRTGEGLREIAIGLAIFAVYLVVTHKLTAGRAGADGRGRSLLRVEAWLHIDVETSADHWLAHHSVLGWLAAWEYATTYILTTFLVLGWIWWQREADYRWARNTLAWTTLLAIACFAIWPTTPPRLLPGHSFADIVAIHHPILSWGGGTVSAGADQYAAMPSLHIGWAVWVTVVTLRARATRLGWSLAVVHLVVTALVVVATGNHYVLDIVAGFAAVWLAAILERLRLAFRRLAGERVSAADEFFLHVETPTVQQPVGGFVLMDTEVEGAESVGPDPVNSHCAGTETCARRLDLPAIKALFAARIDGMPRLQQRIEPAGWLHHARWVDAPVDLDWHVREYRLPAGGGRPALMEFVSALTEQQLARDRPLWQAWFVPNVGPNECAAVVMMHHVIGDGLGIVDILRQLLDPVLPPPDLSNLALPSVPRRAAAAGLGVLQLAADGVAERMPYTAPLSGRRYYRVRTVPASVVIDVARNSGSRVTDVLLTALGQAVAESLDRQGARGRYDQPGISRTRKRPRWLRVAVPVTTRLPAPEGTGRLAEPGNLTAALRLDVPLGRMSPLERLRTTHEVAERRRSSGRALGAAAVVRAIGLFPPPMQRLAARGVYRGRHFGAIVSNMPGPTVELTVRGTTISDVYPIMPLAEDVPIGIGTLGWAGRFCVSLITDAVLVPDADHLLARFCAVIDELATELDVEPSTIESPR